jgi:hypothetical protein
LVYHLIAPVFNNMPSPSDDSATLAVIFVSLISLGVVASPSNSTTLAFLCVSLISLGVVGYCIYGTKTKTIDPREHKPKSVTEGANEVIGIIDLA